MLLKMLLSVLPPAEAASTSRNSLKAVTAGPAAAVQAGVTAATSP